MNKLATIKNKGIKITKHKLSVLELFNSYKHLDATQIYEILHQKNINISIATIYRILSIFEQNHILEKHNFNDDQFIYELIDEKHHDHLICVKCRKVIEFTNDEIEELQEQIARHNKFEILDHSLNIYGICHDCKNT